MDKTALDACMNMSFADVPFPQVVQRLVAAGVRTYRNDLIALATDYYGGGSAHETGVLPLTESPVVGEEFAEPVVAAAVHAIQRGEIGYAEFLRRIMRAGCASYCAYLAGRRVIYFGRNGAFHIEDFPRP
jgi:uncharacterized protein YbcV (DUF1398 family)